MLRRLFIVLQYLGSIPVLIFLFFWLFGSDRFWSYKPVMLMFVLSLIPYGLIILGKWIIYGKFHIYKIEEGEENKLRDSSRKGDSENRNQDSYEPPFPDGF